MADTMTEVDEEDKVKILEEKVADLEATDDNADAVDDGEVQIIIEDDGHDVAEATENGETPTASQEAVNSLKSRRSREFEELRKRAASANKSEEKEEEEGAELSAFERMQLKKRQELEELRARGGFNAANKSRFDTGQALTTGMLGFERSQKLAAEEERKKRLEASEGLKKTNVSGMSSWERNQLLGKDEARRRQLEAREGLHRYRLSLDPGKINDESPTAKQAAAVQHNMETETNSNNENNADNRGVEETPEKRSGINVAAAAAQLNETVKNLEENNAGKVDKVVSEPKQEKPIKKEQEEESHTPKATEEEPETDVKSPSPKAKEEEPETDVKTPPSPKAKAETPVKASSPKAKEDVAAAAAVIQRSIQNPPTYARVDIKFSFGLVVKSGTTDENLRDSETLRKCMSGTKDILTEQLPPPPKPSEVVAGSTVSFPPAFYDPILEPNVLGIQEDKSKKPAKGKNNTRTLCKASFPIFIREETADDDGKKRAALSLKETKATIFKALRAAVSGGSFLK